jgi:hypothetical protein
VPGVTPAAISLLLVHLKKGRLKTVAPAEAANDAGDEVMRVGAAG